MDSVSGRPTETNASKTPAGSPDLRSWRACKAPLLLLQADKNCERCSKSLHRLVDCRIVICKNSDAEKCKIGHRGDARGCSDSGTRNIKDTTSEAEFLVISPNIDSHLPFLVLQNETQLPSSIKMSSELEKDAGDMLALFSLRVTLKISGRHLTSEVMYTKPQFNPLV